MKKQTYHFPINILFSEIINKLKLWNPEFWNQFTFLIASETDCKLFTISMVFWILYQIGSDLNIFTLLTPFSLYDVDLTKLPGWMLPDLFYDFQCYQLCILTDFLSDSSNTKFTRSVFSLLCTLLTLVW